MVIIQPATHRVVVLYSPSETDGQCQWFFPRGRKDIGESLQQAALREAHEEARAISDKGLLKKLKCNSQDTSLSSFLCII